MASFEVIDLRDAPENPKRPTLFKEGRMSRSHILPARDLGESMHGQIWAVVPSGYIDAAARRLRCELSADEILAMAHLVQDFAVEIGTIGAELTMKDLARAWGEASAGADNG